MYDLHTCVNVYIFYIYIRDRCILVGIDSLTEQKVLGAIKQSYVHTEKSKSQDT